MFGANGLVSKKMELCAHVGFTIIGALGVFLVGDLEANKSLTRVGVFLCYMSFLLTGWSFLTAKKYEQSVQFSIRDDEALQKYLFMKSFNIFKEDDRQGLIRESNLQQDKIYQQLDYYYDRANRSVTHFKCSVFLVGLGSVFQIAGAG